VADILQALSPVPHAIDWHGEIVWTPGSRLTCGALPKSRIFIDPIWWPEWSAIPDAPSIPAMPPWSMLAIEE
jgi:hypothetical protein